MKDLKVKFELERIRLNNGGYDRTGTYYGIGAPLLTCIQKSDVGTFEQFCSDFGYDTDSRRDEQTWKACAEEWTRVSKFWTSAEIEQLQEVQ